MPAQDEDENNKIQTSVYDDYSDPEEEEEVAEKETKLPEDDPMRYHYMNADRDPGDEEPRIGKVIKLREDTYSLAVAVQRKTEVKEGKNSVSKSIADVGKDNYDKIASMKTGTFEKFSSNVIDLKQSRATFLAYAILCYVG